MTPVLTQEFLLHGEESAASTAAGQHPSGQRRRYPQQTAQTDRRGPGRMPRSPELKNVGITRQPGAVQQETTPPGQRSVSPDQAQTAVLLRHLHWPAGQTKGQESPVVASVPDLALEPWTAAASGSDVRLRHPSEISP